MGRDIYMEILRYILEFTSDVMMLIVFLLIFYLTCESYRSIKQIKENLNIK